jgi:acetyltransferase-like isoleucine patch superfamily enzyme
MVGDNVYIGPRAYISASKGISIGNGVTIGPEFMVMGGDHNFRVVGLPIADAKSSGKNYPIIIEDDVWIGARVTVLKGVRLGEGAIVGAGSVVTRNVAAYSVSAGNPAKRIGDRFSPNDLSEHLKCVGSKYQIGDSALL